MLDKKTTQTITELGKRFSFVTIMMHEAIARAAGLSGTDHKYLNILIEGGPMTAGNLARISGLTTGAVTNVIDRLEKQHLVKRQFVKDDRRKVIIVPDKERIDRILTPSFKKLKDKIVELVTSRTTEERMIVEKYLKDVIEVMEQLTADLSSDEK